MVSTILAAGIVLPTWAYIVIAVVVVGIFGFTFYRSKKQKDQVKGQKRR